jgi:heptosyltransferase III
MRWGPMNSARPNSAAGPVTHGDPRREMRRNLVSALFSRTLRRARERLVAPASLPSTGIHRILVCRPNHRLGNIILLTPLVRALELAYPGAEIDLLVGTGAAHDVFAGYPRVRKVISLGARMARHPWHVLRTLRGLRRADYDLVVDAGRGSQSGRIFAAMIGGKRLLGVADPPSEHGDAPLHFAHRPVQALAEALIERPLLLPPYPSLCIRVGAGEAETARAVLRQLLRGRDADSGVVIGLFANATGAKKLDTAWWYRLIDRIQQLRPDYALVEMLPAHGSSPLACRVPTYFSTDIRAMAAIASQMTAFVSADCGVMHLASAAGAMTYGLFSCTSAELYGPFDHGSRAFDADAVTPEQVAESLLAALEARREPSSRSRPSSGGSVAALP